MTTKTPLDSDSRKYKGQYLKNPGDLGLGYSNNHTHRQKFDGDYYLLYHTLTLDKELNTSHGFRSLCVAPVDVNEKKAVISECKADLKEDMQMLFYCMDERSLLLYKKGAKEMARWAEDKGHMLTVVPTGTEEFELPLQNLAGIWGFWQYYLYSGDESVPECVYEMSKKYVQSFDFSDSGLIIHKPGSWDWVDWGENADTAPMENAWYYMAVSSLKNMAALLGKDGDIPLYDGLLKSLRDNYLPAFSKGDCIYNHTENGIPDDRANALAVLSGLVGKESCKGITRVLSDTENASPYMEKYVLDALSYVFFICINQSTSGVIILWLEACVIFNRVKTLTPPRTFLYAYPPRFLR